jgi:hypothetical protein
MLTLTMLRKLAMSFPDVTEEPHFEKTSFRYRKKIFAAYDAKQNRVTLKLSLTDQDVFGTFEGGTVFYPVAGAWGHKGYTYVELAKVRKDMLADALELAYREVGGFKEKCKTKKDE